MARSWWCALALALASACSSGEPCLTQEDCNLGSYCERAGGEGFDEGSCVHDCLSAEDCAVADPAIESAVCDNQGRCRVTTRPPRLRVLEPENDLLLAEGTRSIRLVGEVETAHAQAVVEIEPVLRVGCASGDVQTIAIQNREPGKPVTLSFVSEEVPLDPGVTRLTVRAEVGGVKDVLEHVLEVPCPGCATIAISTPERPTSNQSGLELPRLEGTVDPPTVREVAWRVRGENGDVLDGGASVVGGRFSIERIPLFAGKNRVQVVVTGVGSGLGETRCSAFVIAGNGRERGLRGLLTWDGPSADLDLHLVGPGGRYLDPISDLSPRAGRALFGGRVTDDLDGLGPEVLIAEMPPDGVYGVVIEPVFDDRDPGANALLRLLWNGRLLVPGPIGPAFVSSAQGDLWVAGTLRIESGAAEWRPIGAYLPASMPPTRPPSDWPMFY